MDRAPKPVISLAPVGLESPPVQSSSLGNQSARRPVGIDAAELIQRLKQVRFPPAEVAELKNAMSAANDVFIYANGHRLEEAGCSLLGCLMRKTNQSDADEEPRS